jgi:DNA polymerase III epsilon subunit-like protein
VTSLSQQQHSFSHQPCRPPKDPLHQSIDLLSIVKQRKCGVCGQLSHNRRKCPAAPAATANPVANNNAIGPNAVTAVAKVIPPPPPILPTEENNINIDWVSVLYVVFDLETTGRSRQREKIIKLAAVVLNESGVEIEDNFFAQFMKPRNPIPPFISELTSITNKDVSVAESFPAVGHAFIRFIQQHAEEEYENDNKGSPDDNTDDNIILVGHNGKVFDIPFLIHQLSDHGITDRLFQDGRFGLGIDTLHVACKGIRNDKSGIGVPSAYNLPTLFQFVTGLLPSTWHCAMADVKATATIFRFPIFWDTRSECNFFDFSEREWKIHFANWQAQVTANDSDLNSGYSILMVNLFLQLHPVQKMKKAIMFH